MPEGGEVEVGSDLEEEASPQVPSVPERLRWEGKDFYAQLDVAPDATLPEIRKSYLIISKACHPDKVSQEDRQEAIAYLQAVTQAWEVLRRPIWRQLYDERPAEGRRHRPFTSTVQPARRVAPAVLAVQDGTDDIPPPPPPTFDSEASCGPTPTASRSERKGPLDSQPSEGPPTTVEQSGEKGYGGNETEVEWES